MDQRMQDLLKRGAALLTSEGAREVYIFGSVASGTARESSDVDLAVTGLPPERFFSTMARLANLFDRSVDLVDLDDTSPFTEYLKKKGMLQRVA